MLNSRIGCLRTRYGQGSASIFTGCRPRFHSPADVHVGAPIRSARLVAYFIPIATERTNSEPSKGDVPDGSRRRYCFRRNRMRRSNALSCNRLRTCVRNDIRRVAVSSGIRSCRGWGSLSSIGYRRIKKARENSN